MQKKTREDKTQKCNSAVLWSKKQKNNISKILRRAKKKKIYAKNIREDTKSEKIKNKNVILQNNIFHNHIFLCKKIRR